MLNFNTEAEGLKHSPMDDIGIDMDNESTQNGE
jgi:hypothetical protein